MSAAPIIALYQPGYVTCFYCKAHTRVGDYCDYCDFPLFGFNGAGGQRA